MPDTNQVQKVLNDPNFYSLPIGERQKVLTRLDPNFAALPPQEQLRVVSQRGGTNGPQTMPPTQQQSWLDRAIYGTPDDPTFAATIRKAIGNAHEFYNNLVNRGDAENLNAAVRGQAPPHSQARQFLLRSANDVADLGDPRTVLTGVGIGLANTNPWTGIPVDAALVAHGGYGVLKNRQAIGDLASTGQANPDQLRDALTSASEMAGGAAGAGAQWKAALPARVGLAQKLVQPLLYEGVNEATTDTRFGVQPERGVVNEGLWGTKRGMVQSAGDRIAQLKSAASDTLQTAPGAGTLIDAAPAINEAVDDAIAQGRGRGQPELISRLENLREALLTQHGPTFGTPAEINQLKSNIQGVADELGAYRNSPLPAEVSAASAAGRAASGIRQQVNLAVPEAQPLNQRMADLIDARQALQRSVEMDKGRDLFAKPTSTMLRRTIGSAPVRTGLARLLTLGDKWDIPPTQPLQGRPTPFPGPAAPDVEDADFTDLPPVRPSLPPATSTGNEPLIIDLTNGGYTRVPGAPGMEDQFLHPPMPSTTGNIPPARTSLNSAVAVPVDSGLRGGHPLYAAPSAPVPLAGPATMPMITYPKPMPLIPERLRLAPPLFPPTGGSN